MTKRAQDFLLDTALGEKKFEVAPPAGNGGEDKTVLSIEEGAVPTGLLRNADKTKLLEGKGVFISINIKKILHVVGKPGPADKATFFRLLSIMINAGVPLIKSLDTIADQTLNRKLRKTVFDIARAVENGGNLSDSMVLHGDVFSESHVGMIKSGEASGQLHKILGELALEVEKVASITRKVKGAMIYPAFIFAVMIVVVIGMMVLVIPKMSEVFLQTGQDLPQITRVVIGISNFMVYNWYWIFIVAAALVIIFIAAWRTPKGKMYIDWFVLRIPIIGDLLKKSIIARFSRSLGNLLGSGIPIIQSLAINAKGIGNVIYRRRIELASEDIIRGISLAESLRDSPEFPAMVVQMISIGEQTAQLETISAKIAEYYEEEVDVAVNGIAKVIEPVILIIIGVMVGGIVGAIMMPMIQLTQSAGAL